MVLSSAHEGTGLICSDYVRELLSYRVSLADLINEEVPQWRYFLVTDSFDPLEPISNADDEIGIPLRIIWRCRSKEELILTLQAAIPGRATIVHEARHLGGYSPQPGEEPPDLFLTELEIESKGVRLSPWAKHNDATSFVAESADAKFLHVFTIAKAFPRLLPYTDALHSAKMELSETLIKEHQLKKDTEDLAWSLISPSVMNW